MDDVHDVIVVGAGMAGLYGVKALNERGFRVLGLEAEPDVGGVWLRNAYPGARVDVESLRYCYYFDPALFREWTWTERFATQPELLAYFREVATRYNLRRHYRFDQEVVDATWQPDLTAWRVTTDQRDEFLATHLIMATGQLSQSRRPPFEGLDDFAGDWVQTSEWRPVPLDGRVAVVGTGSSGVQASVAISKLASHLFVVQRTPGYVLPIPNGPFLSDERDRIADSIDQEWELLLESASGLGEFASVGVVSDFNPEGRTAILNQQRSEHQLGLFTAFADFSTNREAADCVSEHVRAEIREQIPAELAQHLIQTSYPIGVRRIVFAEDYYSIFRSTDTTLVDVAEDPIDRIVPAGIRLASGRIVEVDTIVFALGFEAFMGAIDHAHVRNQHGAAPSDHWGAAPQTYLGLMTEGFPNFFIVQGPGSPSTLSSNMNLSAVQTMNFVTALLEHARVAGADQIEVERDAVDAWTAHCAEVASPLLRLQDDNYMVQRNADGTRVMIPYAGGVGAYFRRLRQVESDGFAGFRFTRQAFGPTTGAERRS